MFEMDGLEKFILIVVLFFVAIIKQIPMGIKEIIGYIFIGVIYAFTAGLIVGFIMDKFYIKAKGNRIAKFIVFTIFMIINGLFEGYLIFKILHDGTTFMEIVGNPYYWASPFIATNLQIHLFKT